MSQKVLQSKEIFLALNNLKFFISKYRELVKNNNNKKLSKKKKGYWDIRFKVPKIHSPKTDNPEDKRVGWLIQKGFDSKYREYSTWRGSTNLESWERGIIWKEISKNISVRISKKYQWNMTKEMRTTDQRM